MASSLAKWSRRNCPGAENPIPILRRINLSEGVAPGGPVCIILPRNRPLWKRSRLLKLLEGRHVAFDLLLLSSGKRHHRLGYRGRLRYGRSLERPPSSMHGLRWMPARFGEPDPVLSGGEPPLQPCAAGGDEAGVFASGSANLSSKTFPFQSCLMVTAWLGSILFHP